MLALYLVPTGIGVSGGGSAREPVGLAGAMACPGFIQSWAHIPRGPLVPFTLLVVKADSFAPLDADPRAIRLGVGARLVDTLDADTLARPIPLALATRLTAMGVDASGTITLRQLYRRFAARLEPTLDDSAYEKTRPSVGGSITDAFTRSDGDLGANWVNVFQDSTNYIKVVSNTAQMAQDATVDLNCQRRVESAFPDNHYAQTLSTIHAYPYSILSPCTRMSADGDGYSCYFWNTAQVTTCRLDNGVPTFLSNHTTTTLAGASHTLKIDSVGNNHHLYKDGTEIGTADTDSTYTSGKPGMFGTTEFTAAAVADDFECTDASGGAAATWHGWVGGGMW